jgi:DNA helicase-2/ATP-dependent DNA helicase PcrA
MSLNKEQELAVNSRDKRILCLAGAGTGKTYSMISRINRLVDEDKVSTSNILVLTFTNAAAAEMTARYQRDHKGKLSPNFCTFHSFCYQLIARDVNIRNAIGYTEVPTIPTEVQLKSLRVKIKQKLGIKLSDAKLEGDLTLTAKEKFEYDLFWKQFKKSMKQEGYITFDMMCYDVCKLFVDDADVVQSYKNIYKYIFVDEFQDTDKKQFDFISSFTHSDLFVIGDVKQAIYSFRGADSSIIKSLAKDDEWTTIRLVHNYRSTKQICDFANQIGVSDKDPAYNIDLESDVEGNQVHVCPGVETKLANHQLKDCIANAIIDRDEFSGTLALLARTNAEVTTIKQILNNLNVTYTTNNKSTDAPDILKSALDDNYMVLWLSTKLNADKYTEYIRLCALDECYKQLDNFLELYRNNWTIYKCADKVYRIRQILDSDQLPYQKCMQIISELRLHNEIINIVSNDSTDIIDYLIEIAEKDINKDALIYTGTIHSVKGLEYDTVLLFGVDSDSFRLTTEENRNLYYVGATRAKSELYVFQG